MSDLSFANDLWDSFESVVTRMTEGKTFCQDFFRFFVELSKITKEFGTKLAAITKNRGADTGTTNLAWLACLQEVENMANKTLKLADDITYRVYNPIEVHLRDTKKTKQKGKETGRRLSEKLVEAVRVMNSAKAEYEKAMRIFDQSQAEHDRIAHLNDINALNKARKKIDTDKKTADRAESAYRKSVEKAKELETKMLDTELPRILSDFETIEKQRIGIVKTSLLSFTNSVLEFTPSITQNCESLLACVDNADIDRDVHDFIEDKKTGKKKDAVRIEYEPYNPQYKTCMKEGVGSAGTPGVTRSASAATISHSPSSSSINSSSSSSSSSSSAKKTSTSAADTRAVATPVAVAAAPAPASEPVIARCRCLFDYTAGQPTELSFQKDEIINVLYKDPSGWWKGEVNGRVGFFPSVDWTEEIFDTPAASSPASFSAPTPVAVAPTPEPVVTVGFQPPANTFRCRALYSLSPEGPDELPLVAGETLYIESRSDGWFLGFNGQGMKGLFPSNFVVFDP